MRYVEIDKLTIKLAALIPIGSIGLGVTWIIRARSMDVKTGIYLSIWEEEAFPLALPFHTICLMRQSIHRFWLFSKYTISIPSRRRSTISCELPESFSH